MTKTSIATEAGQESSPRGEVAIRKRVREVIEMALEEKVEAVWGAGAASAWRSEWATVRPIPSDTFEPLGRKGRSSDTEYTDRSRDFHPRPC